MSSLIGLREGLAARISTIVGLRSSATMPDNPRPPMAVVIPERIEYDLNANRGADTFYFIVTLIVARADDRAAQNNLDQFVVGDKSVKAAIEADRTLGGVANTCRVTQMRNYQQIVIGDAIYLGCEFEVEVFA